MLGGEAAAELFGFGGVKELARWGLSGTVNGFSQMLCSLPSLRKMHPCRRRCRSNDSRFIRLQRVAAPRRVAPHAKSPRDDGPE